ncbi:MAG: XdhC/CoxI family protein [Gemmatimonadales bacterium]|nr:XdhC/CoxI family protein [Gemmatimonadales bacterium]
MIKNQGLTTAEGDLFQALADMASRGEPGVLATVINTRLSTPRHPGSKMIVYSDGSVTGSVGGGRSEAKVIEEALQVMSDGECRTLKLDLKGGLGVCGGEMDIFLEPVVRGIQFLVIGAGHIGRAVLELGSSLPFRFTVIDDRPEALLALEGTGGVRTLESSPADLPNQLDIPAKGALLLASRSHELDGDFLQAVFAAEQAQGRHFPFLGVLASQPKARKLCSRFAGDPFCAKRMEQIQLPVGLDLAAETPAEIALSILAEAMAVLRGVLLLADEQERPLGVRLHRRRGGPT